MHCVAPLLVIPLFMTDHISFWYLFCMLGALSKQKDNFAWSGVFTLISNASHTFSNGFHASLTFHSKYSKIHGKIVAEFLRKCPSIIILHKNFMHATDNEWHHKNLQSNRMPVVLSRPITFNVGSVFDCTHFDNGRLQSWLSTYDNNEQMFANVVQNAIRICFAWLWIWLNMIRSI